MKRFRAATFPFCAFFLKKFLSPVASSPATPVTEFASRNKLNNLKISFKLNFL